MVVYHPVNFLRVSVTLNSLQLIVIHQYPPRTLEWFCMIWQIIKGNQTINCNICMCTDNRIYSHPRSIDQAEEIDFRLCPDLAIS